VRVSFDDPVPVPDWRFPPTDERPLDDGLRVYRVQSTETVVEFDRTPQARTFPAHVAVDETGAVLVFPTCTAYLPGGRQEVERELDAAFSDLSFINLVRTCETYREIGAPATLKLFRDEGWDVTNVELRTVFIARCEWIWETPPVSATP
jgi:hypothetical protein